MQGVLKIAFSIFMGMCFWALVGVVVFTSACERSPIEEHELTGKSFSIRVQRKLNPVEFQYQYLFQSKGVGSETWSDIVAHSQDDPNTICKKCLSLVNDTTGYFYVGSTFSVTVDSGENWRTFNVLSDSEFGRLFDGYCWIQNVEIANSGRGLMTLRRYENQTVFVEFVTSDFGQTWQERKLD